MVTTKDIEECIMQSIGGVVGSPRVVIRNLIMMGYEPVGEYKSTNFLGQPGFRRLGLLSYGRALYHSGGWGALFLGWKPRFCEMFVYNIARRSVERYMQIEPPATPTNMKEEVNLYFQEVVHGSLCSCIPVLFSHPFNVIANRTVAQFVGNVTKYEGPLTSLMTIYREEGIQGLYSGLVPALLCEVAMVASVTLARKMLLFAFQKIKPSKLEEDNNVIENIFASLSASIAFNMASPIFHPFIVVKVIMEVNGTSLPVASEPFTPKFDSWTQCYSFLHGVNGFGPRGLLRGSSILRRFYSKHIPAAALQ